MDDYGPLLGLAVALGIGLIIGLEREQHISREQPEKVIFQLGGARTYPLVALTGGLAMLLSRQVGTWLVGLLLAGLIAIFVVAIADDIRQGRDRGITSEIAMVATYLIGALALSKGIVEPESQTLVVSAALGVAITTLLSFKAPLHGF